MSISLSSEDRNALFTYEKKLVYLGREYPAGYTDFFRPKLKAAFLKKRELTDEQEILKSIQFGEYIIKGKLLRERERENHK